MTNFALKIGEEDEDYKLRKVLETINLTDQLSKGLELGLFSKVQMGSY